MKTSEGFCFAMNKRRFTRPLSRARLHVTLEPLILSLLAMSVLLLAISPLADVAAAEQRLRITVHKTPTCGCCQAWVDYLKDHGYDVETHNHPTLDAVKARLKLHDVRLHSCHTATVEGYIVEGHVPVSDIERLLRERPDIVGLTAPGMPMMSPGMNSIEPKDYDVLSFDRDGNIDVFSRY